MNNSREADIMYHSILTNCFGLYKLTWFNHLRKCKEVPIRSISQMKTLRLSHTGSDGQKRVFRSHNPPRSFQSTELDWRTLLAGGLPHKPGRCQRWRVGLRLGSCHLPEWAKPPASSFSQTMFLYLLQAFQRQSSLVFLRGIRLA